MERCCSSEKQIDSLQKMLHDREAELSRCRASTKTIQQTLVEFMSHQTSHRSLLTDRSNRTVGCSVSTSGDNAQEKTSLPSPVGSGHQQQTATGTPKDGGVSNEPNSTLVLKKILKILSPTKEEEESELNDPDR